MEEMQQSVENAELQNDQQQTDVGTEPTNRELLNAMIGLDNPITDEYQTGEDDTIIDDESDDAGQEPNNNFYSATELFDLIKNNQEVDESRMTDELKALSEKMLDYKKSLQGDYTKKTQEVAKEKKTVKEQLEALQKEKELVNEAQEVGLTADELIKINEDLDNRLQQELMLKGLTYNDLSEQDKEKIKINKDFAKKELIEKQIGRKKLSAFESSMKKLYGEKYTEVDKVVGERMQDLPVRQYRAVMGKLSKGEFDIFKSMFEEAYNELYTQKQAQPQQQTQAQEQVRQQKQITMPPHSVGRSNVPPKKTNKEWQNYI